LEIIWGSYRREEARKEEAEKEEEKKAPGAEPTGRFGIEDLLKY